MQIRDRVLKLNCQYQQDDKLEPNYNWCGYVLRTDNEIDLSKSYGFISTIEGTTVDNQINKVVRTEIATCKEYIVDYIDKRYLCGQYGMRHLENTLEFIIFTNSGRPIDYEFKYDEIDNCFYGVWYFVDEDVKTNFKYDGFAKLEIEQNVNYEEYKVQHDICCSTAYEKYGEKIYSLMCEGKPTLQLHDKENLERFDKAKEYFRGISRKRKESKKD